MNYSSYRSEPSYYEERSPGGASARTSMALATGMPQNLPSFDIPTAPSDSVLAAAALADEAAHRFPSFRTDDAITLGLSLRKRFRASRRSRTRSMVISVTALSGAPLFQCAVGDGVGTEDWGVLGGMIEVVRRTGHCSWYVEKGLQAVGEPERYRVHGGAFPIFLENAPVAPVAVVAAYSGSSEDDHRMVVNGVRDYIRKQHEDAAPTLPPASIPNMSQPATSIPPSSRAQSIAPSSRPQSVAGNRDSGNSFSSADWLAMHAAGAIHPDELEGGGAVSYTDGRSVTGSVVSSSSTAEPLPLPHGESLISGHGQSAMSRHGHRSVVSSSSERDGSRSHVSAGVGRSTVAGQSRAG